MGCEDDGETELAIELREQTHYFGSVVAVQVTGRFVGKDKIGVSDDRSPQRRAASRHRTAGQGNEPCGPRAPPAPVSRE